MDELITYAESIRAHYEPDNKVGLLLDELVSDLRAGALRAEIVQDAADIRAEIGDCTASRAIVRMVAALPAAG